MHSSKCVPFDAARRAGRGKGASPGPAPVVARGGPAAQTETLTEIFDHLSPAQYAFLSGVLAILAEHGEEALTRSCEMVIERFGRGQAG